MNSSLIEKMATQTREKKDIHTKIRYELWFAAQTSNLKWANIVEVGIKVLTAKVDTKEDIEQRIQEKHQKIAQNVREIAHFKQLIIELGIKEAERKKKESKNIIMRF